MNYFKSTLGRHAPFFRLVVMTICAGIIIFFIGAIIGGKFSDSGDQIAALLIASLIAFNGLTLYLLGDEDAEERRLKRELRKKILRLRIQQADQFLGFNSDTRKSVTPDRDAERLKDFLQTNK